MCTKHTDKDNYRNHRVKETTENRKEEKIMKIGFIGLGNMATAIIGGMLQKKVATADEIVGHDKMEVAETTIKSKFGVSIADSNVSVVSGADIVFLAVKPLYMEEVITEIKDHVGENTLIVSIAAGKTLQFLYDAFGSKERKIIRCMPNTPALVLEGCTGVCAGENVTEEELEKVLKLLNAFGKASVVPERLMDVVVGVSGSSPAYVFLFIEAMADAAVAGGMPRAQAYEFAAQSVLGSAKLVLETGKHPGELKDMVCSPGGTTIQAVKVLEEKGFRAAVMDAVEACIETSKNL